VRIVHVYNQLDPQNGGPPHVIVGLAAGQMALGHEVVLISEDPQGQPEVDSFLASHLDPVPTRHTVHPRAFLSRFTRQAFKAALADADIAHLHGVWPIAAMMASRICKEMNIPYIFAPHGSLHAGALTEKRLKKLIGMWSLGYRAYIRDAAALHALNTNEAEGAAHPAYVGVQLPDLVQVIPNGVFTDMLSHRVDDGLIEALLPTLNGAPYILYLARLHPGKGCDLLGEAFVQIAAKHPELHLVMVGQDQGGRAMAERPIAQAGLDHRVHFTGPIFDDRKYALYKNASVYCLPSRHEGFSMAITEAMAWRCPIVATQTCYFPELTEYECGIETQLTAAALASGIDQLLTQPDLATKMGERGRALVEQRYTWPRIAAETIRLYQRCLEAK
jgi:glycosyltransferase involved in cell wall biosynthesis